MNVICLIGRAGTTPELKILPSGARVTNFNLAVPKKDKTNWVRIVAWNKTAELIVDYVKKGDLIGITGSLDVREYQKDDEKRTIYEVIADKVDFCSNKGEEQEKEEEMAIDVGVDLPF